MKKNIINFHSLQTVDNNTFFLNSISHRKQLHYTLLHQKNERTFVQLVFLECRNKKCF